MPAKPRELEGGGGHVPLPASAGAHPTRCRPRDLSGHPPAPHLVGATQQTCAGTLPVTVLSRVCRALPRRDRTHKNSIYKNVCLPVLCIF